MDAEREWVQQLLAQIMTDWEGEKEQESTPEPRVVHPTLQLWLWLRLWAFGTDDNQTGISLR